MRSSHLAVERFGHERHRGRVGHVDAAAVQVGDDDVHQLGHVVAQRRVDAHDERRRRRQHLERQRRWPLTSIFHFRRLPVDQNDVYLEQRRR